MRSTASSFRCDYSLSSLRSSSSFLRFLPRLSFTSIPPCVIYERKLLTRIAGNTKIIFCMRLSPRTGMSNRESPEGHMGHICFVMRATFVLSWGPHLCCHEGHICVVMRATFVLSWDTHLCCHEGHICVVMRATFVLSWGPHTTTNWSHLIKIIAEYFYYLNLETCSVHTNGLSASHIHECKVMK
jgi:hypothetical protein